MWKFSCTTVLSLIIGCSSHEASADGHETAHDTGAAVEDAAASDAAVVADAVSGDAVSGDAPVAGKPATPTVTSVMAMAGAWHVGWKTNATALTKVELWRSNDGAEATLVKALAGTAKDWHDAAAPGTTVKYCWKVKTFRGAEESDLSAEKCSK